MGNTGRATTQCVCGTRLLNRPSSFSSFVLYCLKSLRMNSANTRLYLSLLRKTAVLSLASRHAHKQFVIFVEMLFVGPVVARRLPQLLKQIVSPALEFIEDGHLGFPLLQFDFLVITFSLS